MINLSPIVTGPFQVNCYVAWDASGQALIFDPGEDPGRILEFLTQHRLEVSAYICTHGHADHICALAALHAQHPAPVAMHGLDWDWAFDARFHRLAPYYPLPEKPATAEYLPLEQGNELTWGGFHLQCIETPGHTPGSCCLLFPEAGMLISGDTLFRGSCGRTDLPGGSPGQMRESLNKLKQLPDAIRVFPGHGPETTIGIERSSNPYMQ